MMNTSKTLTATAACLGSILLATPVFACGGFFCNGATPVNQQAERIIFAHDGEEVTQIVEVLYDGDAEKFSWILPVVGTPSPGVSSVQALDRLQAATNPTYRLQNTSESCGFGGSSNATPGSLDSGAESADGAPKVVVLDQGSVGPFVYETISVDAGDQDPADAAVRWLEANEYDVGPKGAEVLRPYLENGLNLIAFKLEKGQPSGAVRPISLQYKSKDMSIPIRPTAVAANDDMPILVWVLGDDRSVSTNYRGLEINELLVDWFNPNDTYNRVVTAAANEAGGQGFVTEFAGASAPYADTISPPGEGGNLEIYENHPELSEVMIQLGQEFGAYDGYLELAAELSLREGFTPSEFVSCPSCYFYPNRQSTDPTVVDNERIDDSDPIFSISVTDYLAALEEKVLQPISDTAELFREHGYLTRLYTTMSAAEMDRDPVFKFNPDLEDVSNTHVAEQESDCDGNWLITLPDGQQVIGDGRTWPHALDNTELPINARIVQYDTEGPPQVISDNVSTIQTLHGSSAAAPVRFRERGCSASPDPRAPNPWLWLLPALAGAVIWNRRRQSR